MKTEYAYDIFLVSLSMFVVFGCGSQPESPHPAEEPQSQELSMIHRPLWDSPIKVQTRRETVETNVILIGPEKSLSALSDVEIDLLRGEAESLIESYMMYMLVLPKNDKARKSEFVDPLNEVLGREAVIDVAFEPLTWGEAI